MQNCGTQFFKTKSTSFHMYMNDVKFK